jgi:predicted DsbA family dithiol-disulfide isomerase
VHEALFRAYFEERRDIGDIEVLGDVAAACGLERAELQAELEAGHYAERVDRYTVTARERGVMGTPAMIFDDRFMVSGAQDYLVYEDLLRRMGAPRRETP